MSNTVGGARAAARTRAGPRSGPVKGNPRHDANRALLQGETIHGAPRVGPQREVRAEWAQEVLIQPQPQPPTNIRFSLDFLSL